MKTAGRETPNRWAKVSSNRANGAVRQNTSCSFKWAEKQENFQPSDECFFLTSPFIEHFYFAQTGHSHFAGDRLAFPLDSRHARLVGSRVRLLRPLSSYNILALTRGGI